MNSQKKSEAVVQFQKDHHRARGFLWGALVIMILGVVMPLTEGFVIIPLFSGVFVLFCVFAWWKIRNQAMEDFLEKVRTAERTKCRPD